MHSRRPKPNRVSDKFNSSGSSSSPRFKKDQESNDSKRPRIKKVGDKPSGYGRSFGGDRDKDTFSYLKKTNERVSDDKKRSRGSDTKPSFNNSFGRKSKDVMERFNKRSDRKEDNDRPRRSFDGDRNFDRPYKPREEGQEGRGRSWEKKEGFGKKEFSDRRSAEQYSKAHSKDFKPRESREDSSDRPFGNKPWQKEDRPFGKKRSFGEDKNFGEKKSFGEKRGYGDKNRPYHAAENPIVTNKKKTQSTPSDESLGIRLNRFVANCGVCARREADKLIEAGEIYVNGKAMTDFSYRVQPSDTVRYGSKTLKRERYEYLLLNKPKDFLTTTDDPEERKTVMDLVRNATSARLYPVGRLDRNTTGLLVLTNDGELAERLMHPSFMTKKIYQVDLDRPISDTDFQKLKEGIHLEDGFIKADDIDIVSPDRKSVGLEIHSGRNRIVRRMFEHLDYVVVRLDRVMYAGLTKKELPRGTWRHLTDLEVRNLKNLH